MFYVVGTSDTRGEFYPQGVTKSKKKAEVFQKKLQSKLQPTDRQWISIKEVPSI